MNNYFAIGREIFPFDDTDHTDTMRAYRAAVAAAYGKPQRIRVWRPVPKMPELCRHVVGEVTRSLPLPAEALS